MARLTRSALSGALVATLIGYSGAGWVPPATAQAARQVAVEIKTFQFQPGDLAVRAGTRVTWTNRDDIGHTVTSGTPDTRDGRFNAPLASQGATFSSTFTEPGTYSYFCDRHQSMRGQVRVN